MASPPRLQAAEGARDEGRGRPGRGPRAVGASGVAAPVRVAVARADGGTPKLVQNHQAGPELRRYGFDFDRSTVYPLVSAKQPPKIPLELVVALCKILDCRFEDLVTEVEPENGQRPRPRGAAPAMPEGPVLSGDFFDAES